MISILCTKNGDLNVLSVEACLTAVVGHVSSARWSPWLLPPFQIISNFLSGKLPATTHTCMHLSVYLYIYISSPFFHHWLAEQAPGDAYVDARVMKAIPDWIAVPKFIFNLFNEFFITIWKAVPIIEYCNAPWSACDLVSITLMILL